MADRCIVIEAPQCAEERVLGVLSMAGLDAVEIRDVGEDRVEVRVYWSDEAGPAPMIDLRSVPEAVRLPDRIVPRTWAQDWPPIAVGPFWLAPVQRGFAPKSAPSGLSPIWLEAGWGFGFGEHPSTRLALTALAALSGMPDRVLDIGCGTGVLGLAALKLGARQVAAIDTDPQARTATATNAQLNGQALQIGDRLPEGTFALILANITPPILTELAPAIMARTAPGGRVVLSGLPTPDAPTVARAYAPMSTERTHAAEGWTALTLRA